MNLWSSCFYSPSAGIDCITTLSLNILYWCFSNWLERDPVCAGLGQMPSLHSLWLLGIAFVGSEERVSRGRCWVGRITIHTLLNRLSLPPCFYVWSHLTRCKFRVQFEQLTVSFWVGWNVFAGFSYGGFPVCSLVPFLPNETRLGTEQALCFEGLRITEQNPFICDSTKTN